MQLDAGFGALSAVYELLVQDRRGVIHVLPDIPSNWKTLTFDGILTEGGFKISAKLTEGIISEIVIDAQHDGHLNLAHGMGKRFKMNDQEMEGETLALDARAGQKYTLSPFIP
jgi:alpha-L-fucosidase 2